MKPNFFIQARKGYEEGNIRCYFNWRGQRIVLSVGHNWGLTKWCNGAPKPHTSNAKGIMAKEMNAILAEFAEKVEGAYAIAETKSDFGRLVKGDKTERATFASVTQEYCAARVLSESTKRNYEIMAKILDKNCDGEANLQIAVNRTLVLLRDKYGVKTFNVILTFAKTITAFGNKRHLFGINDLTIEVDSSKTITNEIVFLTPEEIKKIEECDLSKHKKLECERDLFLLQCYTGLRASDIYRLTSDMVNDGKITIRLKKTGKVVTIPLTAKASAIIERGIVRTPNNIRNWRLKQICRKSGIDTPMERAKKVGNKITSVFEPKWKWVSTHTGRKSFVCNCIAAGVHINVIMSMTGHSDFASIKPYLNVSIDTKEKGIEALSNLLG